jgi:hypothetical protein
MNYPVEVVIATIVYPNSAAFFCKKLRHLSSILFFILFNTLFNIIQSFSEQIIKHDPKLSGSRLNGYHRTFSALSLLVLLSGENSFKVKFLAVLA